MTAWYVSQVNPVPWKAPTATVRGGAGGKRWVQFFSPEELVTYKEGLADDLLTKYPKIKMIEDDPIELEFFFFRSLDQLGQKGNRKHRAHVADATNLQKSTEDALQGLLFKNDVQVKRVTSNVIEQTGDTQPCVVIRLDLHDPPPIGVRLPTHVMELVESDEKARPLVLDFDPTELF